MASGGNSDVVVEFGYLEIERSQVVVELLLVDKVQEYILFL
jgi:hypothetical protein